MKLRLALTILAVAVMGVLLFLPKDVAAASLPGLDDTCLETELKGCSVTASGYMSTRQGLRVAFQVQDGFTEEDGVLGGIVLFTEKPEGWTLFGSAFEGYYEPPHLVEHEQTLLHVPGYTGGTGAYNADLLFVWGDTGAARYFEDWRPIDLDTWLGLAGDLLPAGLEIWKGVDYDFDDWFYGELDASTPHWRSDDGNCCPSGGWATIYFAIDNSTLVATSLDYQPPAKAK